MISPTHLSTLLILVGLAAGQPASVVAQTTQPTNLVRVYSVNKTVAEFTEQEDFSTPESAYAAINRVMASGQPGAWGRVSIKSLASRLPAADAKPRPIPERLVKRYLEARIIEVRMFNDVRAGIIAEHVSPDGESWFDLRGVELEDGRWLNSGQGSVRSLDNAREQFAAVLGQYTPPQKWPKIDDPDSYLQSFVEHLQTRGEDPQAFLLNALAEHRLVVIGEVHHRPLYWEFNSALVAEPRFAELAGKIYLELPSNGQFHVDDFLTARRVNTALIVEMLRDMLWMGWPDQAMLDFFVAVRQANQILPKSQRLRIVLVDMSRPWSQIKTRADWAKYEVNRDECMADAILEDMRAHASDTRNALFIAGAMHATENLRYLDQSVPMRSAAWRLRQELGADVVFTIVQHRPAMNNAGGDLRRLQRGLFDSAFEANGRKPVAFELDGSPFGARRFDAQPERATLQTYSSAYDAYLYLGPLEDEIFSPLIPGFYTDAFVQELDRRHRLTFGRGLVEAGILTGLRGAAFTAWMGETWGRPRKLWQRYLGPRDEWQHGDEDAD